MKKPFLLIPFFILLILGYFHPITAMTQDLGRHILTGKIIMQTHHVPKTNLFSYTYPAFPFVNHHWLSEVLFFLLSRISLIMLLSITVGIMVLTFGILILSRRREARPLAFLIAGLFYLPILFERTDIRPEVFSFLFFSVIISILWSYRSHHTKLLYLIPLLELLWVNMHIYFFIGIIALVLFCMDYVIKAKGNLKDPALRQLILVTCLSGIATLLNPNLLTGALYPLHVLGNYGYTIEENQNIFFLSTLFKSQPIFFFKVTVVLLFLLLCATQKKTRPIDWFIFIFFAWFGAYAVRNLPLFVIATFPLFARQLSVLHEQAQASFVYKHLTKPAVTDIFAVTLVFVLYAIGISKTYAINHKPLLEIGASNAATFLLQNRLPGPIFNNFDIGSYLEYRIYPKERVFIDGRPEAYPASFIQQVYIPMQQTKTNFDAVDAKYHFNTVFFSHTDQTPWAEAFLPVIWTHPAWKLVYLDDTIMIFVKNIPQNAGLIKRFAKDRNNPQEDNLTTDTDSLRRLLHLYGALGNEEKMLFIADKLVAADPNSCVGLYVKASIATKHNDPSAGIQQLKYTNQCGTSL